MEDDNAPLQDADDKTARPRRSRPYLDLFVISFLILFFELAAIRWFGSTVVFLTFFTNIVLLATFLGMSVGLLTASQRRNYIRAVIPLALFCIALAVLSFNLYIKYGNRVRIDLGRQTSSPGLIYFGAEYRPTDVTKLTLIPLWAIAGTFFAFISITFVGLGQAMGRAFDAIPNRVLAYTIDVLGSLSGIAVFAAMSYLQLSPHFWFLPIVLLLLYLSRPWTYVQVVGAIGIVFMVALTAYGVGQSGQIFWSPYYKIAYVPQGRGIDTNNISHQQMVDIEKEGSGYVIPHLLNRDTGGSPFEDVMIIGAGSGNDVSTALRYGAKHIDAVEIDPMINLIGRWDHPNHPYDDPRVTVHLDDGRSFARKTKNKYDLAIYALVDSLVLHSGYSSLRLENFLFTKQAFEDVKKTLKPGGVFAVYNYFRQGWVVDRLKQMGQDVFGVEPIIISMPYQETIYPWTNQSEQGAIPHRTFVLMGSDSKKLEAIRAKFKETNFWVNYSPLANDHINGFRKSSPDPSDRAWDKIAPANVITQPPADTASLSADQRAALAAIGSIPQDNWPQLYLREKKIPWAPVGQGMVTIAAVSIAILLIFGGPVMFSRKTPTLVTGAGRARPNFQMFFLGAGFMLLETKGVVHMALLFGSTWVVNSVVFFAILVMILIANLYTLIIRPKNLWPYYALLVVALLVNALVPMDWFLSLNVTARTIGSCAVVFVPVFFAGVIFASSFRDSRRPDVDFGCNVAGIILGGLSEQLSLMIGFNYLLLVAIAYYALSALLRRKPPGETIAPIDAPAEVATA